MIAAMPHLTIAEMTAKLKELGLARRYKPVNDPANIDRAAGREVILLEVRRPAKITGGEMSGAEIDIYDRGTVRVWTAQKSKAMRVARENNFRVRLLDGEAELYIPMARADEFLHGFGAKVKTTRPLTPEQAAAVAARFAKARAAKKVVQATTS